MLDIVYKKVSTNSDPVDTLVSGNETQVITKTLPPLREPSWLEKTTTFFNHAGGYIEEKISNSTKPTNLQIGPKKKVKSKRPQANQQLKQAKKEQIKELRSAKVEVVKKKLSTTHGKMLVVHSLLIVALGAYALHLKPIQQVTEKADANANTSDTITRRYLPSIKDITSQPFSEVNATLPRQSLGLYRWVTPWGIQSSTDTTNDQSQYAGQSAFWLTVSGNGSTVVPKADWSSWDTFQKTSALTYLSVSGNPDIISNVLIDPNIQQAHITALLNTVKDHNFVGIDIDYEGLGSINKDLFTSFIKTLTAAFHAENKKVAVTLEARIANQVPMDWHSLGSIADEIRVMAYDYHSRNTGTPGPVAPLGWVQEVTAYAVSQIPAQKVIIGLGNYGYDWQQPGSDSSSWSGIGVSADKAVALATERQTSIIRMTGIDDNGYDIGSIPSFVYTDTSNVQHSVWYEDAQSLQEKINVVSQYPVKGVIFWSIGLGNPDLTDTTGN